MGVSESHDEFDTDMLETAMSEFGEMKYVKHSVSIDGVHVGWDRMPSEIGSDLPEWKETCDSIDSL